MSSLRKTPDNELLAVVHQAISSACDEVIGFVEPFRSRAILDIDSQNEFVRELHRKITTGSLPEAEYQTERDTLINTLGFLKGGFFLKYPRTLSFWYSQIDDELTKVEREWNVSRDILEEKLRQLTIEMGWIRNRYIDSAPMQGIQLPDSREMEKLDLKGKNALLLIKKDVESWSTMREKPTRKDGSKDVGDRNKSGFARFFKRAKPSASNNDVIVVGEKPIWQPRSPSSHPDQLPTADFQRPNDTNSIMKSIEVDDDATPLGYYLDAMFTLNTAVNGYLGQLAIHYTLDSNVRTPPVRQGRKYGHFIFSSFSCRGIPLNPDPVMPAVQSRAVEIALRVPYIYAAAFKFRVLGRIFGTDWDPVYPKNLQKVLSPQFLEDFMDRKKKNVIPQIPQGSGAQERQERIVLLTVPLTIAILWQIGMDRIFLTALGRQICNTSIKKVCDRLSQHYGIYLCEGDEHFARATLRTPSVQSCHSAQGRAIEFDLGKLGAKWYDILDEQVCYWVRNGNMELGSYNDLNIPNLARLDNNVVKRGMVLRNERVADRDHASLTPWKANHAANATAFPSA